MLTKCSFNLNLIPCIAAFWCLSARRTVQFSHSSRTQNSDWIALWFTQKNLQHLPCVLQPLSEVSTLVDPDARIRQAHSLSQQSWRILRASTSGCITKFPEETTDIIIPLSTQVESLHLRTTFLMLHLLKSSIRNDAHAERINTSTSCKIGRASCRERL